MDENYDTAINLDLDFDYKYGIFRKKKTNQYLKDFVGKNVRVSNNAEEFDVVFVTDVVNREIYPNATICMVYHGPTFNKTVTYRELKKHSKDNYLIFAESQYAVDRMIEADCLGNSKTEIVGFPKMDPILNDKFDRTKILNDLGLDASKKTIVYAPTYKPTSLFDLKDDIFESTTDYNLIIKLHHYSWMGKYANRNQNRVMQKQVEKYDHAVLIPRDEYNIMPLFAVADTLISEASGGLTEFLITEKIAIIYDIKNKGLKHSDDQPLMSTEDNFLKDAFITIYEPNELNDAIRKALNPIKSQIKNIKRDKDKYFYKNNGKASQRIKTHIDKLFD
jgi:CDP-glycerol glycerophosphotransferase (TagB/SpsB family)